MRSTASVGANTLRRTLPILLAAAGCSWLTPFAMDPSSDAGADAADADDDAADADDPTDADGGVPDSDGLPEEGPLVLVSSRVTAVAERVCDVDGDGSLDNAIADIGAEATSFAVVMNAAFDRAYDEGKRAMVHFPWIDDLSVPEAAATTLVSYAGLDADGSRNPGDDFYGAEPFYAAADFLDACGEPRRLVEHVRIEGGVVSAEAGVISMSFEGNEVRLVISELSGTMAAHGAEFRLVFCGTILIEDLGRTEGPFGEHSDLTLLEGFLGGGRFVGIPIVGIEPNVDLDGDGLERFILDDDVHIATCIDGDRTTIEGRDCWQDPRIADGFALTLQFEGTSATYGGRQPMWEYLAHDRCDGWPVAESFFSTIPASDTACAALDDNCDPLAVTPCCDSTHRCSGAGETEFRCSAPCAPERCDFGGRLASCEGSVSAPEPVCWALGERPEKMECTVGEVGCETEYGVTDGTHCFDNSGNIHCAERCAPAVAACGDGHRCIPLPFTGGGVCVRGI